MTQELKLSPSGGIGESASTRTILTLLVGIVILSCSAIFTRLSEQELSPLATIFDRFWIASIVLGFSSGLRSLQRSGSSQTVDASEKLNVIDMVLMVVLAVAISARAGSWAWSLTQTTVANSNLLHNMTPIFATLGGWIFLGHSFDRKYLMGLTLAILGVISIGIQDLSLTSDSFYGDVAALLSSVFYAVNFLIIEKLRAKLSTAAIMTWSCVLVTIVLLPGILLMGDTVLPVSISVWASILCLGILSQVFGQGILAYVLSHMKSGHVSLFLLLEPILTALLAWTIFGERLSPSNWFAFLIVLFGLYLANSSQSIQDPEG